MLVVAPLRVCRQTWPAEVAKWTEFKDLRVSILHGSHKAEALKKAADVYLINPEGIAWLVATTYGRPLPFDVVCIDELTKFKNARSIRSKKLRMVTQQTRYKWGLTGSLRPNTHMDLFGQQLILDGGEALGRFITHFRNLYFIKSFNGFSYDLVPGAEKRITERLAKTWFYMDPSDYSQLPPLVEDVRKITLLPAQRKLYSAMKRDMLINLPGGQITAANAGACYSKLAQLANGAIYTNADGEARKTILVHDQKLDALDEIVEELDGEPLLLGYEFNSDLERIRARFKDRLPGGVLPYLGKGTTLAQETDWITAWNRGELPIMAAHPASAGHGLNLQEGSAAHICWFSVSWDWELYDQFIRRVRRSGNEAQRIFNHLLIVENSIDELKLIAQHDKDMGHTRLLAVLNEAILRSPAQAHAGVLSAHKEAPDMVAKLSRGDAAATPAGWGTPAPPVTTAQEPAPEATPAGWGTLSPAADIPMQKTGATPVQETPVQGTATPAGWGNAGAMTPEETGQRAKIQEVLQGDTTPAAPEQVEMAAAAFGAHIAATATALGNAELVSPAAQAEAEPTPVKAKRAPRKKVAPAPGYVGAEVEAQVKLGLLQLVFAEPTTTLEEGLDQAGAMWAFCCPHADS